jgi:glyoxylase-like metal-dependent hydrolase (beta-lactamase superfamily II)
MKMHALSGGRLRMRKLNYLPDAPREATIELPVACWLLRHAQGNVLFDTGCHPAVADNASARWGSLAKAMVPISPAGDHVLTGLQALGLAPDDIDVVIASHLHSDHCGCNAFFTRATLLCHAAELAAARAPESDKQGYLRVDWDHALAATDIIEGPRDLFGDGRITLIPLPGHTAGTTAALVALDRSGAFLLASDVVPLRATLDRDIVPRTTWNPETLSASLAEVRRIEAGGATIICGHDDAQWASLRKGAAFYD